MTASHDTGQSTATAPQRWIRDFLHVLNLWTGAVFRRPRPVRDPEAFVPAWHRLATSGMFLAAGVVVSMLLLDAAALRAANTVPHWVNRAFNEFTDFGRSVWFLVPLGVCYLLAVALAANRPGRFTYGVLASIAVRLGFMFVAIGLPGLLASVVKRLIGRARPSEFGPFAYEPLSWRSEFASLPSGHTTTTFAALVAVGVIFPRIRMVMWLFAVMMGVSRVIVSSHFPSDVIAGAAFGAFGAILVRDWFAARRLGFVIGSDGTVQTLPGPSWRRIKESVLASFGR